MTDYHPIEIGHLFNASLDVIPDGAATRLGHQVFRGLPFDLGADPTNCVIACGDGRMEASVVVDIGVPVESVVIAHRLIDSEALAGGAVGSAVADYVFEYADGVTDRVVIRDRFEIAAPGARSSKGRDLHWGHLPFLAVSDHGPELPPRTTGYFGKAGYRQTEVLEEPLTAFYLWAWVNPRPEVVLRSVSIEPRGPLFIIGAITIGDVAEHPLVPAATSSIKVSFPGASAASGPGRPSVQVDRGSTTFPYPVSGMSAEAFLRDPLAGWGDGEGTSDPAVYLDVSATPSATFTVREAGELVVAAPWRRIQADGSLEAPGVRIEVVHPERNWVRTTIVDEASGLPIPCRVHFRSPDGIPFQPHGHHAHINGDLDTWHVDVGGDVRLGHATYAYIDGTCEGWLPRGDVIVDVARGFEYEPLRTVVTIAPGQQTLRLAIRRWTDLRGQRWFSGDTHVHFLSTQGSHLEAQGEDLSVVNLLQSQWGHLFTSVEDFIGEPSVARNGQSIVYVSQENRQHMLGHLSLLGLTKPVMPWSTDGPGEAEMGGGLEITLADWADQCHAQGGTVILPHLPIPNGEPAALIATGRADAAEMVEQTAFFHAEYYRYLNGGYQLPLVGGTDKMSSDVPVGLYRTYVHIPADEDFTYESWCRNLRAGRTFLSGGPLISLSVDGHAIGDTVELPRGGGVVEVEARVDSIFPIHGLQLVQAGRVVGSTESAGGSRTLTVRERLRIDDHTWLAARAGGADYFDAVRHRDVWGRGAMAHTSPIYVAVGGPWNRRDAKVAEYMMTLIHGSLSYIDTMLPRVSDQRITHHHGGSDHLAYLRRPFFEAIEAIDRRNGSDAPADPGLEREPSRSPESGPT